MTLSTNSLPCLGSKQTSTSGLSSCLANIHLLFSILSPNPTILTFGLLLPKFLEGRIPNLTSTFWGRADAVGWTLWLLAKVSPRSVSGSVPNTKFLGWLMVSKILGFLYLITWFSQPSPCLKPTANGSYSFLHPYTKARRSSPSIRLCLNKTTTVANQGLESIGPILFLQLSYLSGINLWLARQLNR